MKAFARIALRTLIVLAVAAVVAGGFWFVAQHTGLLAEGGPPTGSAQMQMQGAAGAGAAQTMNMRPEGGHDGQEGASLAAFTDIVKDFLIIALIVAGVAVVQWLFKRLARNRRPRPDPALAA